MGSPVDIIIIIIIIKNEKIRVTLCENAAGALYIVNMEGEDLWWEAFVEQVCLESGMEERGRAL